MPVKHNRKLNINFGALIAPIIIVAMAVILSLGVADRFQTEQTTQFKDDAEDALHLVTMKLDNYRDLLYAGRAFVASSDSVTNTEWRTFYNQQAVFDRYQGVSSIAYINSVQTADLKRFEAELKASDYFGPSYALKDQSDRPVHGIARAYVSQNDLSSILGIDLLASEDRYEVYKKSEAKGSIVASPPFKLATGYDGFFSVLPVYKNNALDGYVLTSFRYNDLMKRLFADTTFGYRITDITSNKLLYESGYEESGNHLDQTIDVGGQSWKMEISRPLTERPVGRMLPAAIMATALILAMTLYAYANRPTSRTVKK